MRYEVLAPSVLEEQCGTVIRNFWKDHRIVMITDSEHECINGLEEISFDNVNNPPENSH